jgi:GTP-binding protein Era
MTHKAGFIAVVGRPNVGKSTLINAIIGKKISIVTNKPQTTRHRILGVHNSADTQMIFVDTPGIHRNASRAMNRLMNRTAVNALEDADLVLFVSEAERWTDEDNDVLQRLKSAGKPSFALLNKVDKVHPKDRLFEIITAMSVRMEFAEIIPISASKGSNLEALLRAIPKFLPESPALFFDDMVTDRSPEFLAAECIREKLTEALQQELPYGLSVQIEQYKITDTGYEINAIVWVERDSQKGMVVGKGGRVLKVIGREARVDLKKQLGKPVHLEIWVKVKSNWADNEQDLQQLGYESP